uniref:Glycerol-3-phosphate dehydrogenase n=1 Tax=Blastobotrys adeninivorans TaxID=409370 RepID=A0A060SZJ8_BLAAD
MFRALKSSRTLKISGAVLATGAAAVAVSSFRAEDDVKLARRFEARPVPQPPSRSKLIENLKTTEQYDMVVIGGGATGTGVALDAAARGLKVALLERDDFAAGTSSKSTKLVHGGVRYLEKAVWNADYDQYKLVKEALYERRVFLDIAPHLSFALPIMIPLYKYWQLPYYWMGTKCYDMLAGHQNLESSYILTRSKALDAFPMLNDDNLRGAVVYYDGSHNDSRMNVSIALTALEQGADVVNHIEVNQLHKDENGKLNGLTATDLEGGETVKVNAKVIVNATGPFCDSIRQMDDPSTPKIVAPSSGTHIVLPGWFTPKAMGLLDPATSDGRVLFFLPWQGSTIAGTTDDPCDVERNPVPREDQIDFVLHDVRKYFKDKLDIRREDVLAAWSGIRPLVMDPEKMSHGGSQNVVRNHLVTVSPSGLVTIAGGKWTTYRQMAEETVDECVKDFNLAPPKKDVNTANIKLVGAHEWTPLRYIELIQNYNLDPEVAKHLSENYGTRAFTVAELSSPAHGKGTAEAPYSTSTRGERIIAPYPFIDGELLYAIRYEYATTAVDFLARRTRLAFLNCNAAFEALPRVIDLMGKELNWSSERRKQEYDTSVEYLKAMGLQSPSLQSTSPSIEEAPAPVTAPVSAAIPANPQ